MTLSEFFIEWNNKFLDQDGSYGAQCVDVIRQYFTEMLNIAPISGNAIDYWRDIPGFTRIKKGLLTYPQPGDIVIWGATATNPYGHIAICNWVRTFDIGVFEQNSPIGAPCHYADHSYSNILGWLHPNHKELRVAFAGIVPPPQMAQRILDFSGGAITFTPVLYRHAPIPDFSTDEGMELIDEVHFNEHYVMMGCIANSGYDKVSYHPAKNKAFAICPIDQTSTANFLHELLHCVRRFAEFNHMQPYIEDVEKYPTFWGADEYNEGWQFGSQYKAIIPYI